MAFAFALPDPDPLKKVSAFWGHFGGVWSCFVGIESIRVTLVGICWYWWCFARVLVMVMMWRVCRVWMVRVRGCCRGGGGCGRRATDEQGLGVLSAFCAVFILLWAPLGSTNVHIHCASAIARFSTSTASFSCSMHLHMRESSYLQAHVSRIHMARM